MGETGTGMEKKAAGIKFSTIIVELSSRFKRPDAVSYATTSNPYISNVQQGRYLSRTP